MRDSNRIDMIITLFKDLWKLNPDLRFCQLYVNLFGTGDNFYVEDDVILNRLLEEVTKYVEKDAKEV